MPSLPSISSFLIADSVFQQKNGKWCIIGIFDRIQAPRYPVLHHALGLFVRLSDAAGDYDVKVEFRNSTDQVLAVFGGVHLHVAHRLSPVTFGIQTHNLPIPAAGRYFFKLFFNEEAAPVDIPLEAAIAEKGD